MTDTRKVWRVFIFLSVFGDDGCNHILKPPPYLPRVFILRRWPPRDPWRRSLILIVPRHFPALNDNLESLNTSPSHHLHHNVNPKKIPGDNIPAKLRLSKRRINNPTHHRRRRIWFLRSHRPRNHRPWNLGYVYHVTPFFSLPEKVKTKYYFERMEVVSRPQSSLWDRCPSLPFVRDADSMG